MKLWRLYVALFFLVWIGLVAGLGHWPAVQERWPISVVMTLGSVVAGSTPMGGGAVAFPFLVLLFGHSPETARNFGLAIQALGMTSAMIFIFGRGIPVQKRVLMWSALGAAVGIVFGNFFVVPFVARSIVKLLFACLWMSFAALTLTKNREICSWNRTQPLTGSAAIKVGLAVGLLGGVTTSIIGVGVDMMVYTVLVLLYRSDLKVAVPSAVCAMAIASVMGTGLHAAIGDIEREVFFLWLAAGPIVIFGAPVGAYLTSVISRSKLLQFVSALCVLQFVWALQNISPSRTEWLFVAAATLVASAAFYLLYRRGEADARRL